MARTLPVLPTQSLLSCAENVMAFVLGTEIGWKCVGGMLL